MQQGVMSGKIQSVQGWIEPSSLGVTLTHEHLTVVFPNRVPTEPADDNKVHMPFSLQNLGWIRQNPYSHAPNLTLEDEHDAVIEEIKFFKKNGGGTIVENTSIGLSRDVKFFKEVAVATGVNVIAGTGYYVDITHPSNMNDMTVENVSKEMAKDITEGCDDTDIKCGIVGEIGCTFPLTANEKKVLQAAAITQETLGCPVIIHPGREDKAPFEIIRILQEAGGDINKTVMSHLDRALFAECDLLEFAATGCYCEYDLFGQEMSYYQLHDYLDMPCDAERIRRIRSLVQAGHEDKILIAHDLHTKHRLMKYGGHGYSHILLNAVPKMLKRGISQQVINKILIENPKKWLAFK